MATRVLLRTLPRSFTNSSFLLRSRPITAISAANLHHPVATATTNVRAYSTRQTTSSLNDSNPNWSNRPPKETILLDGCDFEHWLVVVEKPEGEPTRDEIIDSYIHTLAKVVGSYDEAKMKIYSVSTRCYFAFGALVTEELSFKLKELPGVRWVLPDSYLDVKNKDYGGEPFIDGKAVPYDPKYHEEWIRNNARANERNRRNDRPRNFDRSRNFERRRENMQTSRGPPNMGGPPPNSGDQQMPGGAPANSGGQQMLGGPPPSNMGGPPPNMGEGMRGPPPPNMGGRPQGGNNPPPQYGGGPPPNMGGGMPPNNNMGGMRPHNMGGVNSGGQQMLGGPPPSNMGEGMGGPPPSNMGGRPQGGNNWNGPPPQYGVAPPPNMGEGMGGPPPSNMGGRPQGGNNWNGPPPQYGVAPPPNMGGGMPPNNNMGGMRPHNMGGGMPDNAPNYQQQQQGQYGPNSGGMPYQSGPGPNNYPPNVDGGNPYQKQDVPGRDMPPAANYE